MRYLPTDRARLGGYLHVAVFDWTRQVVVSDEQGKLVLFDLDGGPPVLYDMTQTGAPEGVAISMHGEIFLSDISNGNIIQFR
jgi:hypothetical protein